MTVNLYDEWQTAPGNYNSTIHTVGIKPVLTQRLSNYSAKRIMHKWQSLNLKQNTKEVFLLRIKDGEYINEFTGNIESCTCYLRECLKDLGIMKG